MKTSLKISNMYTSDDVQELRDIISKYEGIVACEINMKKKEVNIVFDSRIISDVNIRDYIENEGYSIK